MGKKTKIYTNHNRNPSKYQYKPYKYDYTNKHRKYGHHYSYKKMTHTPNLGKIRKTSYLTTNTSPAASLSTY